MTTTSPPPGFYDDPDQPGRKRWWDGSAWTEITEGQKSSLPDLGTLAGGALIADGIVGFGKNREGIFGSLIGVVVGVTIAVGVGLFLAPAWFEQTTIANPVPTQATVLQVERYINNSDPDNRNSSSSVSCAVVVEYTTAEGQKVEAVTPYSSGGLCSFAAGQAVAISYDASSVGKFQGLDPMGEQISGWFPWLIVGVGLIIAVTSFWTFLLRATQIGGGILLINKSRQKDREKLALKTEKRRAIGSS